ncbi:unnamed protein product [Angiostrongylus costaricensis]|uniref:Ovule protein n=1 Tax=Angiostrongylus costaricensis TaxID=334426 RepID=A0A0R3PV77_ANGCS|nr:unnamed protein product [Angiostrongylus costaricensis]
MCVHIENKLQLSKDDNDANMYSTVMTARTIAIDMVISHNFFLTSVPKLFPQFLQRTHLVISTNSTVDDALAMDLYVVKRVCRAVLLTSTQSIHGFWIGFFAEPNIVYYLKPKQSNQKHLYLISDLTISRKVR